MRTLEECKILVVDDTEANVEILVDTLGDLYDVSVAMDGEWALNSVKEEKPDLILLDIVMPGMDGYEVCSRLKESADTRSIPIIFLTALTELASKTKGFELGAVDYVTKPFEVLEVQARVKTHLSLVLASHAIERQNEVLEEKVKERTKELAMTQDVTIHSMASLAETRDNETGGHILRTQQYVKLLADHLKEHPGFSEVLESRTIDLLFKSAPLHDIGKVGVPDAILLKPGKLTDEEFAEMKNHTTIGRDAIEKAISLLGQESTISFLHMAIQIVYNHHERWDGKGYPNGIAETDIPFPGRLMAIADVYDALICKRVYKPAFSHQKAATIIKEGRGTQFDPDVVDAFLDLEDAFRSVALQLANSKEKKQVLMSAET